MMDWEECCKRKISKEVVPEKEMISSLKKSSKNKFYSSNELKMKIQNISSKISLAYDSLREILEALSLNEGYKIYNHECYTSFLKEVLDETEKANEFDEIRKIRNSLNYYGESIQVEEALDILTRINHLRKYFLKLLDLR